MSKIHSYKSISYQKVGSGKCILLLHGFAESSSIWNELISKWKDNYTLLIPDLPGFGNSHNSLKEYSLESLAEEIIEIITLEKISQVELIGHSMGGYLSLAILEKKPEIINSICLLNSTAFDDTEEKFKNRERHIELIRNGKLDLFLSNFHEGLFDFEQKEKHQETIQDLKNNALSWKPEAFINAINAMKYRPERLSVLKEFGGNILLIHGLKDNLITTSSIVEQFKQLKKADLKLLENCGHMAIFEKPDELFFELNHFIK